MHLALYMMYMMKLCFNGHTVHKIGWYISINADLLYAVCFWGSQNDFVGNKLCLFIYGASFSSKIQKKKQKLKHGAALVAAQELMAAE